MAGGGETVRIQPVDVATLTAWRQGKTVFNDTPLAEVVREVNRYRAQPIQVAPALARVRISGVFDVDDTGAFLKALPALVPLRSSPAPTAAPTAGAHEPAPRPPERRASVIPGRRAAGRQAGRQA